MSPIEAHMTASEYFCLQQSGGQAWQGHGRPGANWMQKSATNMPRLPLILDSHQC